MLLQKEIVAYLAGHIVTAVSAGLVEITDPVDDLLLITAHDQADQHLYDR